MYMYVENIFILGVVWISCTQTPKLRQILVLIQSVSHYEDEMRRDRPLRV